MLPKMWIFDSYSVMLLIGIVFVFLIVELFGRRKKVKRVLISEVEIIGVLAIIAGLIGAVLMQNLYDLIEKGSEYAWTWAMTFYGGLLFGAAAFLLLYFLWVRKRRGPCMVSFILPLAPSCIAIAQGFGRVGCFLAGCCYGKETDSWIGVTFPGMDHKVIPTNLMEAIFLFALTGILLWIGLSKKEKWGFPIYLIAYGTWRFVIEFYRGDHRGSFVPGLSPSQFWSIVMIVLGVGYIAFLVFYPRYKVKQEPKTKEQQRN